MNMVAFADKFSDLIQDQAEWSQAVFGTDKDRGPIGALKHLERESREAQAEAKKMADLAEGWSHELLKEELADCLLLILDASRRAGVKPMQLVEAAQQKMVINKSRKWGKPVDDEPVEHIE